SATWVGDRGRHRVVRSCGGRAGRGDYRNERQKHRDNARGPDGRACRAARGSRASDASTQLYVLELSSFQLESTTSLDLKAAVVLNVTPDHLDRYDSVESYAHAKARIFARCETAVINLDDPLVVAMPRPGQMTLSFSLRASI